MLFNRVIQIKLVKPPKANEPAPAAEPKQSAEDLSAITKDLIKTLAITTGVIITGSVVLNALARITVYAAQTAIDNNE